MPFSSKSLPGALIALVISNQVAALTTVPVGAVYQESGGIVAMEAERTPSSLGSGTDRWEVHEPGEVNYVAGASNEAHIEFQGNSSNGGSPKTPLTYTFRIQQGGYYHLHLRARARLDGAESDKNNDCYVKVTGDPYGAGPNPGDAHMNDAPLSMLTSNTKMYGGSPTTWGWANFLDAGGSTNKRRPIYNFSAGGTYTLTISGRSIKFNIDRIVFRHTGLDEAAAKAASAQESAIGSEVPRDPVANGGADKTITLPNSSVVLNGSGNDADGSISSYAWTRVSGPGSVTLSGVNTASLTASGLSQGTHVFRLIVADNSGLTASDDVSVTVNGASTYGQSVTTFTLVNADTDQDIGPLTAGTVIDFAVTGSNLNIRANTSPSYVGSVRFALDGNTNYTTQSGAPYTIGGDTLADYWPWTPSHGAHTVTATPYTGSSGSGTAGTPLTVTFTVINGTTSDGISGFAPPRLQRLAGNQVRLTFQGVPGLNYSLQRSIDLSAWTTLQTRAAEGSGAVEFTDSAPPPDSAYYRLAAP